MENVVGKALADFEGALKTLEAALGPYPSVLGAVFEGSEEWRDLLTYKLVPHLAGEGCLVAAVTGGTNTGKSTVFNLMVGETVSPMVNTAAATCHPVVAANEARRGQCLEGKLVPEFDPQPLSDAGLATDTSTPPGTLYVSKAVDLPDSLILMDTPDVDSIVKSNWEVADHIRAAGDVLVAVVTGEKYKDERVVAYFREAVASSRVVVPLMNKANPAEDYSVARQQLDEFRADVGTQEPRFVVGHDFDIGGHVDRPIASLDGEADLVAYLKGLDVPRIKEQVYRGTIGRFAEHAEGFVEQAGSVGAEVATARERFYALAQTASGGYDPAPGKEVGGLFHTFVQSKRGAVRRAIGNTSAVVVRGASALGRRLTGALRKRSTLEAEEEVKTEEKILEAHRQSLARLTRDLVTRCIETARTTNEPVRSLVADGFETVDLDAAIEAVARETLVEQDLSEEFRNHANATLEAWWEDHKGKRRALEALDAVLAVMPAAIAAPIALHTGGVGVSEAVVVAGPLAAQFMTRVMEYQFGDALFDFLSPWKLEQQERFYHALVKHIVGPATETVSGALAPLEDGALDDLKRSLEQCLRA